MLTVSDCLTLLRSNDDFLILTHHNPDGDTVGSAAALCLLLREWGKTAYVHDTGELSPKLTPFVAEYIAPQGFAPRFIVAVDIASRALLTPNSEHFEFNLCIDHHGSNTFYAAETLLDASCAACAELIYELYVAATQSLSQSAAEAIYLGLVTDTGCFRYPSTTARTLRIGAECVETGIDYYAITRDFIEQRSRTRLALESHVLQNCTFSNDGSFVLSWLDYETLHDIGVSDEDTSEAASYLRSIEGVVVSVFCRERERGSWRVSVRSDPSADAAKICSHLGGGGHRCAAGATITAPLDDMLTAVLDAVRREVNVAI